MFYEWYTACEHIFSYLPMINISFLNIFTLVLYHRKSGTAVATAWTFFYGLFYIDYGPHEHCLSGIQRWYRSTLDGMLGIDTNIKQISDGQNDNNSARTSKDRSGSAAISAITGKGGVDR